VSKQPPPLLRNEVPHGLSTIILDKLLAKHRNDRYQTMGDVASALEQFITRGDGTPVPRRRTAPVIAVPAEAFEEQQTSARLPKPVQMRETPWPVETLDTPIAMGQVSLPAPPSARRQYALYGVAGAGILMGVLGLIVGLRGGNDAAPAPAPIVMTAPAAATMPAPVVPEKIEVSLDADVPNARVVFRRRVQNVPTKLEINSTDVVELVEVSAAGYKTTRFWLTFDRPTFLKAHLVKGTGSVEATEEETLAALGEVIMVTGSPPPVVAAAPAPKTPLPAAAAVAPIAKTVERPAAPEPATQVAMAPRKIGRAAADEPAVTQTMPEPTPVVEAPKADEPKPEPVKTEPEKVVEAPKVEPKPEPKLEEPARPSIDRATVSSVITAHRPEVLKCFAEGKKKNAAMKGTLSLQLQVNAAGAVSRVQVQSTLKNPLVAACVVKAANGWKFPARAGGESATVAYPFTIN
jgi:hypothetical protein